MHLILFLFTHPLYNTHADAHSSKIHWILRERNKLQINNAPQTMHRAEERSKHTHTHNWFTISLAGECLEWIKIL